MRTVRIPIRLYVSLSFAHLYCIWCGACTMCAFVNVQLCLHSLYQLSDVLSNFVQRFKFGIFGQKGGTCIAA